MIRPFGCFRGGRVSDKMDKIKGFINTDIGKLAAAAAGIFLFLIIIKLATPNNLNIYVNNGADCVVSTRSAKKVIKRKPKKNKKKNS